MSKAVGNTHLVADTKALEAASLVIKLVSRVPAPLKAVASAKEVDSHLRLLAAAGAVHGIGAENALETFDQVRAMTWRLLNPVRTRLHLCCCRCQLTLTPVPVAGF